MEIKKVGVMGCGAMGLGVAQVCAQAGIPTVAVKATPGSTDKIRAGLDKSLGKMVERGKMTTEKKDATLGLLHFTTSEEEVAGCDLIVESIIEDLETKKALFQRLEKIVSPQALLTTNTSTLSVTAMMAVCKQRDRVAGLHFFNPAPVMKLVEIIHAFRNLGRGHQYPERVLQEGRQGSGHRPGHHRLHRQPPADALHAQRHPPPGDGHRQHCGH